jgi:dipeptidyl aminopeptidase/acylaminoacyl peptidase
LFIILLSTQLALSASEPLTAERAYRMWSLDELEFSPDGSHLAFTVTGPREGIEMDRNIWLFALAQSRLIPYTFSEHNEHSPRWSPDGKMLAFLSNRSGKTQVHLLDMKGGEARQLSRSKTGVQSFAWSPEGRHIAFAAEEPAPDNKDSEDPVPVRIVAWSFHREQRNTQLWILEVENGETRQLTQGNFHLAHSYWAPNFAWTPDGKSLLVSGTENPIPEHLDNRIYRVRLSNGERVELASPAGGYGQLKVSPDGKNLAYLGPREDAFEFDDLYVMPLSGGKARNLSAIQVDRRIWAYDWVSDSSLLILALDGFRASFYRCGLDGSVEKLLGFAVPPSGHYRYQKPFAAFAGTLAFVGEKSDVAPELWISRQQKARKVSHFNHEWDTIPVLPLEIIRYPSFDGTKIEAGLLKPAGYKKGTRVPLVVMVHGGPSAKFSDRFYIREEMLAARGVAVLMPNIRGSTGYGYRFLTINRKDWGGGDYKDVMAGIDYLIEQGVADPERLGIGGWSYGGYMTTWAVTQTDRFKAGVAGAPMTNLVSEYGTEARWSHYYDTWYMGTPYDNLELFIDRSPVTHVKNVRTPIMLMVGERDDNTPLGQSTEFYRGLRYHNKEAKLVVYPGAGHFPSDDRQRVDVYQRFVHFLVSHLNP